MPVTTTPLDVDGLLMSWLPRSFDVTTIAGSGTIRDTIPLVDPGWTDGRPIRVRDRANAPTKLLMPYGTVTYLHSYGYERPWHNSANQEVDVAVTNETIAATVGVDTYQVRFRDIKTITSVKVDNVTVSATAIVTTADYVTPDAFKLSSSALALLHGGSTITISYTYRTYNFGDEVEGYEVYRLEGKTKDMTVNGRFYPASRLAKMWMDNLVFGFFPVNMQQAIAGETTLILKEAGSSESGAGLLPTEDETEARFVVDLVLYRRTQVFTAFQLRRIGKFDLVTSIG